MLWHRFLLNWSELISVYRLWSRWLKAVVSLLRLWTHVLNYKSSENSDMNHRLIRNVVWFVYRLPWHCFTLVSVVVHSFHILDTVDVRVWFKYYNFPCCLVFYPTCIKIFTPCIPSTHIPNTLTRIHAPKKHRYTAPPNKTVLRAVSIVTLLKEHRILPSAINHCHVRGEESHWTKMLTVIGYLEGLIITDLCMKIR